MKEHLQEFIAKSKTSSVRGLRILLEYFYALETFQATIASQVRIVSVFGSARTKETASEYKNAKKLGALLYKHGFAVLTGGSQGIMQAANAGTADGIIEDMKSQATYKKMSLEKIIKTTAYKSLLKKYSIGLKISLPFEPRHNPFVGVHATFHYFMIRKFFFGTLSSAFIACEGGWGTRDELFEMLTLVQTGKAPLMPIIYIAPKPQHLLADINFTLKEKYICKEDLELLDIVPDYKQAVKIIDRFYSVVDKVSYDKNQAIHIKLVKPLNAQQTKTVQRLIATEMSHVFGGVIITKGKITLTGYNYQSFGHVRRLIDKIS